MIDCDSKKTQWSNKSSCCGALHHNCGNMTLNFKQFVFWCHSSPPPNSAPCFSNIIQKLIIQKTTLWYIGNMPFLSIFGPCQRIGSRYVANLLHLLGLLMSVFMDLIQHIKLAFIFLFFFSSFKTAVITLVGVSLSATPWLFRSCFFEMLQYKTLGAIYFFNDNLA